MISVHRVSMFLRIQIVLLEIIPRIVFKVFFKRSSDRKTVAKKSASAPPATRLSEMGAPLHLWKDARPKQTEKMAGIPPSFYYILQA